MYLVSFYMCFSSVFYFIHVIIYWNSSFWRALCLSCYWHGQIVEGKGMKGNGRSALPWVEQENPVWIFSLSSFAHSLLFCATGKVWKKKMSLHFPLLYGESIYQFANCSFKYCCCVFSSFGCDKLGHFCSSRDLLLATVPRKDFPLSEPLYTRIYSTCKIIC